MPAYLFRDHVWWLWFFCVPPVLFLGWSLWALIILLLGNRICRRQNKRGLLIYSNSQKWKEYVETAWLPTIGDKFIVLNWSERKKWPRSVPVFLFYHYCQAENFNPAAIVLRGALHPLIYRFYPAFQDAVHGNFGALTRLENLLFEELGLDVSLINREEHHRLVMKK